MINTAVITDSTCDLESATVVRSKLHQLFALAITYPDSEWVAAVKAGELAENLMGLLGQLDENLLREIDRNALCDSGDDIRPWHHWDGNTDNDRARNYGSVVGVGGSAFSVRGANVDRVAAWLDGALGPPTEAPFPRRPAADPLVDGGAKLYACKMSVDMMGLKKEDFVDGVIDIVTASDFMDMTEGAQIIFI